MKLLDYRLVDKDILCGNTLSTGLHYAAINDTMRESPIILKYLSKFHTYFMWRRYLRIYVE